MFFYRHPYKYISLSLSLVQDKMKTENEDNEEEEDPGWKSVGDGSSKRKRGEKNVKVTPRPHAVCL